MPMACKVCNHPDRLLIDRAIISGKAKLSIGKTFGVPQHSVGHHAEHHLSRQLVKSSEMKEALQSSEMVSEIRELITQLKEILMIARGKGNYNLALNAINSAKGVYELLCKIAATMYQLQAQQLEAEGMLHDDSHRAAFQEGISKLNAAELTMFMSLVDKMRGLRKDDVMLTMMKEMKSRSWEYTPPKRARRKAPPIDETWSEEREREAETEALTFEAEPVELDQLSHKPLDISGYPDPEKGGRTTWGRDQEADSSGLREALRYGGVFGPSRG